MPNFRHRIGAHVFSAAAAVARVDVRRESERRVPVACCSDCGGPCGPRYCAILVPYVDSREGAAFKSGLSSVLAPYFLS